MRAGCAVLANSPQADIRRFASDLSARIVSLADRFVSRLGQLWGKLPSGFEFALSYRFGRHPFHHKLDYP